MQGLKLNYIYYRKKNTVVVVLEEVLVLELEASALALGVIGNANVPKAEGGSQQWSTSFFGSGWRWEIMALRLPAKNGNHMGNK